MSSIALFGKANRGYHLLPTDTIDTLDDDVPTTIEFGVPAPLSMQELYPSFTPTASSLPNRTVTVQTAASSHQPPRVYYPSSSPNASTASASSQATQRVAYPHLYPVSNAVHAPAGPPPSTVVPMVSPITISSFADSAFGQPPAAYFDPRELTPDQKAARDAEHENFMIKVLHAVDKNESLDFIQGRIFTADLPKPTINLMRLTLATLRVEAMDLLCKLNCRYVNNLGNFMLEQIRWDVDHGFDKKLDKYPAFIIQIVRQNPDKIPPHFLLKAYLCSKKKKFKHHIIHEQILKSIISTFGFTPEKILATLTIDELKTISPAAATMMGIKTSDIVASKKRFQVTYT